MFAAPLVWCGVKPPWLALKAAAIPSEVVGLGPQVLQKPAILLQAAIAHVQVQRLPLHHDSQKQDEKMLLAELQLMSSYLVPMSMPPLLAETRPSWTWMDMYQSSEQSQEAVTWKKAHFQASTRKGALPHQRSVH